MDVRNVYHDEVKRMAIELLRGAVDELQNDQPIAKHDPRYEVAWKALLEAGKYLTRMAAFDIISQSRRKGPH